MVFIGKALQDVYFFAYIFHAVFHWKTKNRSDKNVRITGCLFSEKDYND